jgi:uncharacterized membrane protein
MEPRAEYTERLARWDAAIAEGDKRHQLIANLRLAVVAVVVVLVWLVWTGRAGAVWFAAPAVLFGTLVIWHNVVINRTERSRRARRVAPRRHVVRAGR